MSQGRHGIKILGLSLLAALGLMAVSAAGAQASGEFTILGHSFTSHPLAAESIEGSIEAGELLIPGLSVTFHCTGGTFFGTALLGGVAHLTVLYSGCEVLNNKFCKFYETKLKMEMEEESGFITGSGLGELLLMGSKHYLLVEPSVTIYFSKSTKGCTLPLETSVAGSTVLELPEALTQLVLQPINTIPQMELELLFPSDVLTYGTQAAWLDPGNASAHLSGPLMGQAWGAE